jgi:hypothetical protein
MEMNGNANLAVFGSGYWGRKVIKVGLDNY